MAVTADDVALQDLQGVDGLWPQPLEISAVLADLLPAHKSELTRLRSMQATDPIEQFSWR
ncbi:MAG TPA: hypothetical protein PK306_07710 [Aquabacterium sp.]|nr:hypothetical protein [Aquabacterium sp.]